MISHEIEETQRVAGVEGPVLVYLTCVELGWVVVVWVVKRAQGGVVVAGSSIETWVVVFGAITHGEVCHNHVAESVTGEEFRN